MTTSEADPGFARRRRTWVVRADTARHILIITLLLAAAWAATYAAGGTRSALPHLFYVPIVVAAGLRGLRGTVVVALLASVLCGPLVPFDVARGEPQPVGTWLLRSLFFVTVAFVTSGVLASVEHRYRDLLTRRIGRELRPPRDGAPPETRASCGADAEVERMVVEDRFHPVFQPVYSLQDGSLIAVEALTRFQAPPTLAPDAWFARAAQAGLGERLELAAIAAAITASEQLPADVALSVNCSPGTLLRPELLELVAERSPRPLIVEVTEHAAVDDYASLTRAIAQLRTHGVRLAVDDAGAGFASLRHVIRLEPELIKLDLTLVQDLRRDPVRQALADCLIDFARRTGTRLVAEGIEHPADLTTWVGLGADAAQGYLLGRPGPLPVPEHNDRILSLT